MKTIVGMAAAAAIVMSIGAAEAGGWSKKSGGLVNVDVGDVTALSGISVLNGSPILNNSPILSGNVVADILNGNKTDIGNGILGGSLNGLGILSGNSYKARKGH